MENKKLTRSNSNRMLAGLCGGIAAYFNIDPTIVRILFVIFTLAGGAGVLLYLIMWLIVPMEK